MKKVLVIAALVIASCSKKDTDINQPQPTDLILTKEGGDQTVSTGRVKIFQASLKTQGAVEVNYFPVLRVGINHSAPIETLSNLRVVIKAGNDSAVVESSFLLAGEGHFSISRFPQLQILSRKNTTYSIVGYATAGNGALGATLQTAVGVDYLDQSGMVVRTTNMVVTQTTMFRDQFAPSIEGLSLPTQTLINRSWVVLSSQKMKPTQKPFAWKGQTFMFTFASSQAPDSAMRFDSLRLVRGNDTIPVSFFTHAGVWTRSIASTDTWNRFHVVSNGANGEEVFSSPEDIHIIGYAKGFAPSAANSQAVTVTPVKDVTPAPNGYVFLNRGASSGNHVKLALTHMVTTSVFHANLLWSDMSASQHSGIPGIPSGDWKNGYGITMTTTSGVIHNRVSSQAPSLPWNHFHEKPTNVQNTTTVQIVRMY